VHPRRRGLWRRLPCPGRTNLPGPTQKTDTFTAGPPPRLPTRWLEVSGFEGGNATPCGSTARSRRTLGLGDSLRPYQAGPRSISSRVPTEPGVLRWSTACLGTENESASALSWPSFVPAFRERVRRRRATLPARMSGYLRHGHRRRYHHASDGAERRTGDSDGTGDRDHVLPAQFLCHSLRVAGGPGDARDLYAAGVPPRVSVDHRARAGHSLAADMRMHGGLHHTLHRVSQPR
jgi:hypothetical protein